MTTGVDARVGLPGGGGDEALLAGVGEACVWRPGEDKSCDC